MPFLAGQRAWNRGRTKENDPRVRKISETLKAKRIDNAGGRGKLMVRLPEWIWSNRRYLIVCLKGLFEAEGSYSVHAPTYTYNLSFSNRNPALLDEVERALTSLGFHPERRSYAVRLRKKREAVRFIELIGFRSYNS